VAAAPFHIWTPDVYEGAPAPVVGFMSTAPKAAVFAVLLRVLFEANAPGRVWLIWVSAVLSMCLGNIAALVQTNVKRLLAYSSIAHAGYLLIAFAAAPDTGISAAMFYTAAYAAMNVGAFAVVSHFGNAGERYVTLDDYSGLGRRSPVLAATLTIFLLSLIGIPVTGGFFAKFYVFSAALKSNLVGLTIIAVINSAVAAYYYLRIIVVMYMREEREAVPVMKIPFALGTALVVSLAATIYLGVLPGRVLGYAQAAASELVQAPAAALMLPLCFNISMPVSSKTQDARLQIDRLAASAKSAEQLMSGIVKFLHETMLKYNWVGFYMLENSEPILALGPFEGAMTPHTRIPLNQGICGAAASSGKTVVVDDVNSDSRYLACSIETKSEIVAPVFVRGKIVGELDIDSHFPAAFTPEDRELVEHCTAVVGKYLEASSS
jgi:putative methionine-R-sulfoxide reductase with GAF domain